MSSYDAIHTVSITYFFGIFAFLKILYFFLFIQTEKAYQKQPTIFQNRKRVAGQVSKSKDKEPRFVKTVGLGFKTPREVNILSRISKSQNNNIIYR